MQKRTGEENWRTGEDTPSLKEAATTSLLLRNVGFELPAVLVSHKKWWKTGFLWEFPVSKISDNPNLKSLFGSKTHFPNHTGSVGQLFATSRPNTLLGGGPLTCVPCCTSAGPATL